MSIRQHVRSGRYSLALVGTIAGFRLTGAETTFGPAFPTVEAATAYSARKFGRSPDTAGMTADQMRLVAKGRNLRGYSKLVKSGLMELLRAA